MRGHSLGDTTNATAAGGGRAAEGGRKKDEGDRPIIARATWGPTQGLGLILK